MHAEQWNGFVGGKWETEIDTADFIQKNYTPYTGDQAFLQGPTERTRRLMEDVDAYMAREVLPYAPGAWIEPQKDKVTKKKVQGIVGYEIPFTRYFYEYTPLRSSAEILAELEQVEASIAQKLAKARG